MAKKAWNLPIEHEPKHEDSDLSIKARKVSIGIESFENEHNNKVSGVTDFLKRDRKTFANQIVAS